MTKKLKTGRACSAASDEPLADSYYNRIPSGEYEAICYRTKAGPGFGQRRSVYLFFRIQNGDYHGTELFMACTYPNGKISPRHKYFQQWIIANGSPPARGQRLARKVFPKKLYRVLVRDTQKKHSHGRPMPDVLQYSVVDSILETLTGLRAENFEKSAYSVATDANIVSPIDLNSSDSCAISQGELVDG